MKETHRDRLPSKTLTDEEELYGLDMDDPDVELEYIESRRSESRKEFFELIEEWEGERY